ncbi:MAG TPA: hypothetical protein VIT45_16715 [Allosphingosinicella sp.]
MISATNLRLLRSAALPLAFGIPLAPAFAQTLGQGGGTDVSLWRVVGALILCIMLAAGAAFALRGKLGGKLGGMMPIIRGGDRRLRLVESLRLSHQVDICIVRIDERELILTASVQGANLIEMGSAAREAESGR